jgi:hypothetical protein
MAMAAHAQQQEEGLLQRIENAKPDSKKVNFMQNKGFAATTYGTKAYGTATYGGLKGADVKTFETRSFFGVKNPWFGKKVFDTYASRSADRKAKETGQKFQTDAFAVQAYEKGQKKDLVDASTVVPDAAKPRKYLGREQPDKKDGVDKFTQNLSKDMSIDDVRDLLNKGKGE